MGLYNAPKQLEDEIAEQIKTLKNRIVPMPRDLATENPVPAAVSEYAPKSDDQLTPLALIASAITLLTWRDAERMGVAVAEKIKGEGNLTAAIQAWAEGFVGKGANDYAGTDAQQG